MPFVKATNCFTSLPPKQPRTDERITVPGDEIRLRTNRRGGSSVLFNFDKSVTNRNVSKNKNGVKSVMRPLSVNNGHSSNGRAVDTNSATVRRVSMGGLASMFQATKSNCRTKRQSGGSKVHESDGMNGWRDSSYRSYSDNFDLLPDPNDNEVMFSLNSQWRREQIDKDEASFSSRPTSVVMMSRNQIPSCEDPQFVYTRRRERTAHVPLGVQRPTFSSFLGPKPVSSAGTRLLFHKSLSEGNLAPVPVGEELSSDKAQFSSPTEKYPNNVHTLERPRKDDFIRRLQHLPNEQHWLTKNSKDATSTRNALLSVLVDDVDKLDDEEDEHFLQDGLRRKSVPKFFRSISLRNLLQIGGMNKSRPAPAQGKPVTPPIAPLVSFPSFRVKKSQHKVAIEAGDPEQQRYSGSSLGSAGSSCGSSGSSGSDNLSSIGTDDGFLLSSSSYANGFLKDLEEYNPTSQGILPVPNSFNTFAPPVANTQNTFITTVEMHQGMYGKPGSITNGPTTPASVSTGPSNNGPSSPHMTVHVNPHPHPGGGMAHNHPHQQTGLIQHHHHHHPHPHHNSQPHGSSNGFAPHTPLTSHYQTQLSLEDQGIDMTQSPGRESPSSTASSNTGSGSGSAVGSVGSNGCRHSTASFDSGRASSTIYQGVRYSGLSSESSSGSFRHSYHSSSSSLGSIPPEEICNFDVTAMISQGVPDHEVLNAWLTGVHFECYYQNFIQAGYDMHTISRMTPEDLNAIGVTKPHHRKRLKSEISQLSISDGLPDYIPGSIEEWLSLLKLEEYTTKLRGQGYHSVRQVTNITWEDLEDTGILKLGHQKKFMLAIKRVEDILAGKRIPTGNTPNAYLTPMESFPQQSPVRSGATASPSPMQGMCYPNSSTSPGPNSSFFPHNNGTYNSRGLTPQQHQLQQTLWRQNAASSASSTSSNSSTMYSTGMQMQLHTHQPQLHNVQSQVTTTAQVSPSPPISHPQYHPEVISIQVKNGRRKSLENPDPEPIYGTSSFLPSSAGNNNWQKSGKFSDDGETTPTNETNYCAPVAAVSSTTSTLPRLLKNKPIAKIMGSINNAELNASFSGSPTQGTPAQCPQVPNFADGYKSLPRDIGRLSKAGFAYHSQRYSNYEGPGATGTLGKTSTFKGGPPPPPRRASYSASADQCQEPKLSNGFGTQKNPVTMSGSWSTLPPPPPALSCDAQYSCSPAKSVEEFPPPPDDLVISPQSVMSTGSASSASTSSSTSPNNPPQSFKSNAAVDSQLPQVTSTYGQQASSGCHYSATANNTNVSYGVRNSPPQTKGVRDPSPVGSDFSDSDLPLSNGLMSRGVRRNGSDASFKSNSSTESESIPFANDNAGTIKQQKSSHRSQQSVVQPPCPGAEAGDVLNDIGNMLADLTDELDAILEQEMNTKS